jgi:hypothetical protein
MAMNQQAIADAVAACTSVFHKLSVCVTGNELADIEAALQIARRALPGSTRKGEQLHWLIQSAVANMRILSPQGRAA